MQRWVFTAYRSVCSPPRHSVIRLALLVICAGILLPLPRAQGGAAQSATLTLGSWVQSQPVLSPVGRAGASLAYVPAAKSVLLFGGQDGAHHVLDDTWTWNGVTAVWIQQQPAAHPHARGGAGMAYDAQTGTTVLFGGTDVAGHASGDTWIWDGANWTPAVNPTGPSARSGASMLYDEARRVVVLFGGADQNGTLLNDTWTWDGVNWTQAQPAASPPARSNAAFAYDAFTNNAVIFAGCCAPGVDPRTGPYFGDTWTWDGANWTQQQPASSPPARTGAAFAYDPILASLLLFGGCSGTNSCHLADLAVGWEQLGGTTAAVCAGGPNQRRFGDRRRHQHAAAFWRFGNGPGRQPERWRRLVDVDPQAARGRAGRWTLEAGPAGFTPIRRPLPQGQRSGNGQPGIRWRAPHPPHSGP